MARRISDEEMRLSIVIDGNEAQKELNDLEKSTRNLNRENKDLREEKKRLERQNKKDSDEYRKVTAAIRENNHAIAENATRMRTLQEQVGLTGLTLNQLTTKARQLKQQLNNMIPGSEDYTRIQNDLNAVNGRLAELRRNTDQASDSLNNISTSGKKFIMFLGGLISVITGAVISFQKFINLSGSLSDAQSDVQKTTGMTKKEVDELTRSFGLMKTRTAREELLKLAEEGGRLGITGVKNIQDYLNVANQLKTALRDDLTDSQITEVGKMTEQYKVGAETGREFGGAMLSLGSAINEVSQAGSNQAGFLVDYLKRTVGVATQINMNAADNLGYAATFDEIGQSAEVSGTMMNKVMMDMSKNTTTYAKIAKMSVKDFSDLLAKDANEAMIKFLEGLKGSDEGFQAMILKMDELDEGGARGAQALSALSNNVDKLRARQLTANTALQEATSLTNEYNIKNENLQAGIEKIKNKIESWMTDEQLVEWLGNCVSWFGKFIGATDDTDGSVTKFRNGLLWLVKVFAVVLAAMVTNVAWQKLVFLWTNRNTEATLLYNIAQRAKAVADGIAIVATQAYAAAIMLMRGNVVGATQALRIMATTMLTTPIGMLLGLVAALTTAYLLFKNRVEEATLAQKEFSNINAEVEGRIKAERTQIEMLLKTARDEKASKESRLKAVKELNAISPEYLGNIKLEEIHLDKTTAATRRYIDVLADRLKLQAMQSSLEESYKRESKAENTDTKEYKEWYDWFLDQVESGGSHRKANERKQKILNDEKKLQEELKKEIEALRDKEGVIPDDKPITTPTGTSTGNPDKKYENERKKRIEQLKEYQKERLALEREIEDSVLDQWDDNFNKERQKLDTEYTRKIEDLQGKMVSEAEIELALKQSKNKKLSTEERIFYSKQAQHWQQQNDHLLGLQESAAATSLLKKKALIAKHSKSQVDELNKQFDREKVIRETKFNEELALLGDNDKKKSKAAKEFDRKEREEKKKHLEELLKLYGDMLAGKELDGVDFAMLTDKEKKKLEDDVQFAKRMYSSLQEEITGDTKEKELDLGFSTKPDILGFSNDQWEKFFENIELGTNKIQVMEMAVAALQNVWNQYDQLATAGENRRMKQYEKNTNDRQRRLKRQLDVGIINQDQYNQANQALEADLDRKKAEIEYKQAKRKRTMDIANVITNTSLSIMKAYAEMGPIGGTIAAALIGTMGAIQLATIIRQPLPMQGFEEGLYGDYVKREQDGKLFKASFGGQTKSGIVRKPSYFMAGENGPEMIIDNKSFRQMDPNLREALIQEIRMMKGYENGLYPDYIQNPTPINSNSPNPDTNSMLIPALLRLTEILNKLESNGVIAYVDHKDMRSMKKLQEGLNKHKSIKDNSKIS
ncbi:phage tail tape measure protein [Myroides odoratimimus]|uniref:Phage tail tape measure protein, TP901 family, core region n=1 Tax=Myroides odoratimimus CIP 101113 TaxID=883154 RepID=A0AAV3F6J2_9FLAO|nr:phage tail tape measure protein [Myroides odoratimimus]EHO13809.1 phage tail tape measure protein, TP901 family, core region [Myroides odoratimimus CIP 101113]